MPISSINLPNLIPTPTPNNLVSEAQKYYSLYTQLSRTTTGQTQYTSPSSGNTYRTTDYQDDIDVYNKGEEGLLNLLFKYVLEPYIVTAELINLIREQSAAAPVEAEVTWNQDSHYYNVNLSQEPVGSIYTIRFRTPNDYVEQAPFIIEDDTYTARLSNSNLNMPQGTFLQNRVVTVNVDRTLKIITFNSGSGIGRPYILSETQPTRAEDREKLWINTKNYNTVYYFNDTNGTWIPIVGVWGNG